MSYITMYQLNEFANLGSQMQQYASLYSISMETNKKIVFPESISNVNINPNFNNLFGPNNILKFDKIFGMKLDFKPDNFFNNFVNIRPDDVALDRNVFNLKDDVNYNFTNLFHLYHYWYQKYENDVFNWGWNPEYYNMALKLFHEIDVYDKELVSIHVRRGDYLFHDHYCKLDTDYYKKAISYFINDIEKYHFVIFSNDIEWCKDNLKIEGEMVTFINPGIDYVDMILMSMCHHNILANSSFSWWSGFKNKNLNKKVICPENYIKSYSKFSFINKNWYLPNWISISNSNE